MPVPGSSREGRARAAGSRTPTSVDTGSLHKALLGAGRMPSPRGPSLASVYRCIYCFSLCVCSNPLPRCGWLYLFFPGK